MFVACQQCGFLVATTSSAPRCPRCGNLVDTRSAKPYEPPVDTAPDDMPAPVDAEATAAEGEAVATDSEATDTEIVEASAEESTPAAGPAAPQPRVRRQRHAPSFVRIHAPAPVRSSGWRWWSLVAGLGIVLVLQVLLAQRVELAASARWRPVIAGLCGVLRCQVPTWREPAAFTMLQRSVQPRRGATGVLSINASFRNDARWPQPWPTVLLTLSDMDGRQVGMRAFTPSDYRPSGGANHIDPGQSATIQLDVVEPARQVVAFTFDFH